jgi:hypothetical protein
MHFGTLYIDVLSGTHKCHVNSFQEKETLCEGSCVKKIVFDGLFKERNKKVQ